MKKRVKAFGIEIDPLTMAETVDHCMTLAGERSESVPYVVTPNVDHIINLEGNLPFKRAYHNARVVVVDGKLVRKALLWLGFDIPEVVPGSDLLPAMLTAAGLGGVTTMTVFLLGAGPGVAERAATAIEARWDNVQIVGCYSPPFGFEKDSDECKGIVQMINDHNPDVLVLGLGAPKQELWIEQYSRDIDAGVALCIGATIDFLAGEQKRAPLWVRKLAMEWLHRMMSQPRRLFMRYLKGAVIFPILFLKEKIRLRID